MYVRVCPLEGVPCPRRISDSFFCEGEGEGKFPELDVLSSSLLLFPFFLLIKLTEEKDF